MHHSSFVCSPPKGHLRCFEGLAIMNRALVNIQVQVLIWTDLILSVNFHDFLLMFPLAFSVTCGYCTRTKKWIHDIYITQNNCFAVNHCILNNMAINFEIIFLINNRFLQSYICI